jgi:hypothetical protein
MRGITLEPVPYILEDDRGKKDKNEQTVFWVKPKTHHEANKTLSRYSAAGREGRSGYRDLHSGKLDSADTAEWLNTVTKIENFWFPNSFFADNEKSKPDIKDTDESMVKILDQEWILKEALNFMPAGAVNEIWDVAVDNSKLREGEKKS